MATLLQPAHVECERYSYEDYDNMLDELYGEINVCGYNYCASWLLKAIDRIAYTCGFNDYQEYYDAWICPICEEQHEEEDEALYCCQTGAAGETGG